MTSRPVPIRVARLLRVGLAAVAVAGLAGCGARRALVLDSRPSGARIWVNGKEHGTTPLRIPYVHPGLVTVRIEKEGFEPVAEEVRTETRADAVPGLDLFAENLGPLREHVTSRTFDLVPLKRSAYTDAEMDAILRRAGDFRRRMDQEVTEPGTPTPTRPVPPVPAPDPKSSPSPTKPSGTPSADR
ncbi:MAG: PEGA domain-containing protein [Planctomycetota bacterium]